MMVEKTVTRLICEIKKCRRVAIVSFHFKGETLRLCLHHDSFFV